MRKFGINHDYWHTIGPQRFIAAFGREAYRRLPRTVVMHKGHRKAIKAEYVFHVFGRVPT